MRAMHAWSDLERVTCAVPSAIGIGGGSCKAAFSAIGHAVCSTHQRPVVVAAALVCVLLTLVAVVWSAVARAIMYQTAKRGSAFVRCSLAAIRELRAARPYAYPPTPHCWASVPDRTAPVVVCYVCTSPVEGAEWQSCEYCGVVVHPRCCRYVPHDCKPLAVRADKPLHDWKPAGVLMPVTQMDSSPSGLLGPLPSEPSGSSSASPDLEVCLYCQEPCEVGLFAMEPVWSCTCCHSMAHMRCCVEHHPSVFSAATKAALKRQLAGLETEMAAAESSTFSAAASPIGSPRPTGYMVRGASLTDDLPALGTALGAAAKTPHSSSVALGDAAPAASGPSTASAPGGTFAAELQVKLSMLESHPGLGMGPLGGSADNLARRSATVGPDGRESNLITPAMSRPSLPWLLHHDAAAPPLGLDALDGDGLGFCGLGVACRVALPAAAVRASGSKAVAAAATVAAAAAAVAAAATGNGPVAAAGKAAGAAAAAAAATAAAAPKAPSAPPPSAAATPHAAAVPSPSSRSSALLASSASKLASSASASKRLLKKWFRQISKHAALDRWHGYRIDPDALPPGARPLLVFVNLKSGPQVGATMKRQLLQLLHPLQVVELPRESPEPALRFFAPVPGTRLLIIGGDGTVSWVLSSIDALAQELAGSWGTPPPPGTSPSSPLQPRPASPPSANSGPAAAAAAAGLLATSGWHPPPLAVFPVGTGNDLARCLGWGGGIRALQRQSLPCLLEEVAAAVPTQLDRWNVLITRQAPEPPGPRRTLKTLFKKKRTASAAAAPPQQQQQQQQQQAPSVSVGRSSSSGTQQRGPTSHAAASSSSGGGGAAALAASSPQQLLKVMNNYVGVGIDAKVALEFHQIRDNYPSFFQSQFGNKMWYTGVGMQDLITRSCAGLHQRLTLVCDGVEVPLPPDAEGLVIMNIACHMGGVALWETGVPAAHVPHPSLGSHDGGGPSSPGVPAVPVSLERRHALHDEVLEVVAIGGVLHMGRLAVGLSRGQRLCQGSVITVVTKETLPMQVDGEPWMQEACELRVALRGKGVVLRRLPANSPVARMAALVLSVLDSSVHTGAITEPQRQLLATEITTRLEQAGG